MKKTTIKLIYYLQVGETKQCPEVQQKSVKTYGETQTKKVIFFKILNSIF